MFSSQTVIRRSRLMVIVFYWIVLSEYNSNYYGMDRKLMSVAYTITGNTTVDTVPRDFPSGAYGIANNELKPVFNVTSMDESNLTKICVQSIIKNVQFSVVDHNMEKDIAAKLNTGMIKKYHELSQNIANNILAISRNVKDMQELLNNKSPSLSRLSGSQEANKNTYVCVLPGPHEAESQSVTVPVLFMIIFVLISYIGYISYKSKTRRYRNSNMLIEEDL